MSLPVAAEPRLSRDGFPLTHEQVDIIDASAIGKSIKVTAFAGAAKTTTLVEVALHPDMRLRSGLYLAFGHDAAKDAKKKFEGLNVTVLTTHGLALRWLNQTHPAITPAQVGYRGFEMAEKYNLSLIFNPHWSKPIQPGQLGYIILEWVSRFCGSDADSIGIEHAPLSLVPGYPKRLSPAQARDPRFRKEIEEGKRAIIAPMQKYAESLWKSIANGLYDNPITHDIYLKLWSLSGAEFPYDYLMLDEAQDTSGAVIAAINRSRIQKIIVGDSRQAIYSFRGARDAMKRIRTEWEYTLSTSFRYGSSVAGLASQFLNATSEEGSVQIKGSPSRETTITGELSDGRMVDAVICRTNGGALTQAIELVRAGRNVKLVYSCSKAELLRKLQAIKQIMEHGSTQIHKDYEDFNKKTFVEYMESSQGKQDLTLWKLIQDFGVQAITEVLESGARKRKDVVVVITAHRSKGLEWDSVMLGHDYPETVDDCRNGQEANLLYVAMTRCKTHLDISLCSSLGGEMPLLSGSCESLDFNSDDSGDVLTVSEEYKGIWPVVNGIPLLQMVSCTACEQDKCKHIGADYSKYGDKYRHHCEQLRWCIDFTQRIK